MPPITKPSPKSSLPIPEHIPVDEIKQTILNACHVDGFFDHRPWNLPNIHTQPYDPELDHDWYEFVEVVETEEAPHFILSPERAIFA